MMRLSSWKLGLLGLLVLAGLPVVGAWCRRSSTGRCALDGSRIEPLYRVCLVDERDQRHPFCCLRCAELWLEHQAEKPRAIRVTDEVSGQEIDAEGAYYVRSPVITNAATGNRIHVFRDRAAAEKHVSFFGGRVLREEERPFAGYFR
jgi:hypothetical protein